MHIPNFFYWNESLEYYSEVFLSFRRTSKSTLSTSESTSDEDVSWDLDVTIDKNKHRAVIFSLFIAASMIQIERRICKIKKCAILSYSMCSDSYYLLFGNKIAFNLVNILLFNTIVYVKGWKESRIGPNYKGRLNNQSKIIRAIWF